MCLYNVHAVSYTHLFRGNLPKFVQIFLRDRTFCVRARQSLSAHHKVANVLPQGSPLSRMLFTIAVNGIFEGIEASVGKRLFVDDIVQFYLVKVTVMIRCKMQGTIDMLAENANNVGFSFLAEKMSCVHWCRK